MELDSFLASPRWEILKIISEKPSSPIEIAKKTKTTVSFISQQLKLLEAARIVSKEKTGAFEKGKPRNLFSISKDVVYLTMLTKGFGEKKSLTLESYQKSILRTWFLEDKHLQTFLEEFLIKIKDNLKDVEAIFVDSRKQNPSIILFSEDKRLQQIFDSAIKKYDNKIKLEVYNLNDIANLNLSVFCPIYQSSVFFKKNIEVKGGKKYEEDK